MFEAINGMLLDMLAAVTTIGGAGKLRDKAKPKLRAAT
jgi:hypothetical protein